MADMLQLADQLEAACSIEGKPIGRHMIEGQRMIAKVMGKSKAQDARDIAEVADCMARCLENEMRLFEDLKLVALEAAASLRAVAMTSAKPPTP